MRRVTIFAALLLLVGMSTAFAASFGTQSEDVGSFTTEVSISVPQNQVRPYYLTGSPSTLPGGLNTMPPPSGSVNSKQIDPGTLTTKFQTDATKMHTWQTAPLPAALVLSGPATALMFRNGGDDPITGGLFVCATAATLTSACTQIAGDVASGPEVNDEIPIAFGNLSLTIPAGQHLRFVIVNRGAKKFNAQWGFKSNRVARLELTVIP